MKGTACAFPWSAAAFLLMTAACSQSALGGQNHQQPSSSAMPSTGTQAAPTASGAAGVHSTAGTRALDVAGASSTANTAPAGAAGHSSATGTAGASAAGSGGTATKTAGAAGSGPITTVDCPALPSGMDSGPARVVLVDAQRVVGTVRSLQGAHWDPGPAKQALSAHYVDMGVDMIRTHDAGGINGTGAGDVDGPGQSRMFRSWSADPASQASYNFGPTDALIKNIRDVGAEVYFRVGRSNISGGNTVPDDFDKYAEVVKHIVMHYNQGWANGSMYGIRYFEIWNEPDFLPFWTGTGDQYHDLYSKIATAIKSVEPNSFVGAPANSTFDDKTGLRATFLKYLGDNKLPLDFYSFHKYTNKSNDPLDFARMAQSYRDELDQYGFTATKIINSEWESSLQGDPILGGEAGRAIFTAEALMYMQDAPIDRATSYMNISASATKESLAFGAISKLNATPSRLCAQGGNDSGFAVLAGLNPTHPRLQVVIANYQIAASLMGPIPGGNEESLDAPGLGHLADMTYLDRRTFTYPDKEGYALTINSIPASWGDVTVVQYRLDASNNLAMVSSNMFTAADRPQGSIRVSGAWAHARANPPDDPKGAAQGLDLISVEGAGMQ